MENILPEIPRIHTAIAEWCACSVFILSFNKKIQGWKLGMGAVITLIIQCVFQIFAGDLPLNMWIPSIITAILLMFLWIYMPCELSINDAAYCCVRAFVLAEFAASLEWQTYCHFVFQQNYEEGMERVLEIMILVLIYAVVFGIAFRIERRFAPRDRKMNIHFRELMSAAAIGIAAFVASNISFVYSNTPFSARFDMEIFIVRTFVDFGGLAVLYAHYIMKSELRDKQELDAIKNVLQRQYDQYEMSKENMELLNLKYHDLKNQIAVIRAEQNGEKKEGYLSDLEKHLKIYEARHHTGNSVLDMVLQSKTMICLNKQIEFTCVANGELLHFMDAMDICTIFGNALDNAIECEEQIKDPNKRMIHLTVFAHNQFTVIRCENYFEGELGNVVEGFPETTKTDQGYHGYGLKSIRYSVNNYGGTVIARKHKNRFELKILIPGKGIEETK